MEQIEQQPIKPRTKEELPDPYKYHYVSKEQAQKELPDFLDMMYGDEIDPDYVGYSFIDRTSFVLNEKTMKNDRKMKMVTCKPANQLAETVKELDLYRSDYYVTVNRFSNPHHRDKDHLFGYSAVVVDIDDHQRRHQAMSYDQLQDKFVSADLKLYTEHLGGTIQELRVKVKELAEQLKEDLFSQPDIPEPNAIVFTGRGLQLWWKLRPVSVHKHEKFYKTVSEYYVDKVEEYISSIPRFSNFSVDVKASQNSAGLVRLPGSFNTHTHEYSHFEILHGDYVDLYEEANRIWKNHLNDFFEDMKRQPVHYKCNDPLKYADIRYDKLAKLLDYRHKNFPDLPEQRDMFLFFVFNAYMTATDDPELSFKKTFAFNRLFFHPMPEREIRTYMKTSVRKHGYRCKTVKMIAELEITQEEQNLFKFGRASGFISEEEREQHRQSKAKRNAAIIKYCEEGVHTEKEIARKVGTSPATVYRVLGYNKMLTAKHKLHNEVLTACKRGTSMKKIMKKYQGQLSKSGFYYIRRKADAWRVRMEQHKKELALNKRAKQWLGNKIIDGSPKDIIIGETVDVYEGYADYVVDLENDRSVLHGFEWKDHYGRPVVCSA